MARLILDTSVLIEAERGNADVLAMIAGDDVAIAAITAAELLVGVHGPPSAARDQRAVRVEHLLATVPIEIYDLSVARTHASLIVHARGKGTPRGSHDLAIAATAAATGRTVLTTDRRGFADLPGVRVRQVGDD